MRLTALLAILHAYITAASSAEVTPPKTKEEANLRTRVREEHERNLEWWSGGKPTQHQTSTDPETNFNECLPTFGGVQICQGITSKDDGTGFLGLLENVEACCDAIKVHITSKCSCHRGFDVHGQDPDSGLGLGLLAPVCRLVNPIEWAAVPIYGRDALQCVSQKSYDYGCGSPGKGGVDDQELEARRLESVVSIAGLLRGTDDKNFCFDTPALIAGLNQFHEVDAVADIPYGAGIYTGTTDIAEYYGVLFAGLNHGWLTQSFVPNTADPNNFLGVTESGKVWTQVTAFSGSFDQNNPNLDYTDTVFGSNNTFEGCSTKIKHVQIDANEGFASWAKTIAQTLSQYQRYGPTDICKVHSKYCTGSLAQFASEAECQTFMDSKPMYSAQCGESRPLAGDSIVCRAKHHFMIPTNPALHCPHILGGGVLDINGAAKCDDNTECPGPVDPSWVPITDIDTFSPTFVADVAASNASLPNPWEFGCGTATDGTPFP